MAELQQVGGLAVRGDRQSADAIAEDSQRVLGELGRDGGEGRRVARRFQRQRGDDGGARERRQRGEQIAAAERVDHLGGQGGGDDLGQRRHRLVHPAVAPARDQEAHHPAVLLGHAGRQRGRQRCHRGGIARTAGGQPIKQARVGDEVVARVGGARLGPSPGAFGADLSRCAGEVGSGGPNCGR